MHILYPNSLLNGTQNAYKPMFYWLIQPAMVAMFAQASASQFLPEASTVVQP
jgi:hypothetical protein